MKFSRIQLINRKAKKRLTILGIIIGTIILGVWFIVIWMPGKSYQSSLPPLNSKEITLELALKQDIEKIASVEHNFLHYQNLVAAANFLEESLINAGYEVQRQEYQIGNKTYSNLEVEIKGTEKPEEIIVIGAHYDSVMGVPGANDNGSGAAAVLELARVFSNKKTARTLRFVEFVNEEPPFFQTENMGSLVYAKACRDRRENIVAMFSLDTMGYYSNKPGSQLYPFPLKLFYPSAGNFITFVSNFASRKLVHQAISSFRRHAQFPSEGVVLPEDFPGVGWSDHWSFWQQGYPGIMLTDTAPARYPYYHTPEDTLDKIQYDNLARVVTGLESVIVELVNQK